MTTSIVHVRGLGTLSPGDVDHLLANLHSLVQDHLKPELKPRLSARLCIRLAASIIPFAGGLVLAHDVAVRAVAGLQDPDVPSLVAPILAAVLSVVSPGFLDSEHVNESESCLRLEDIFRSAAGGPELLSPTHHRVLTLTANGRILRFPLDNPHGSSPVESPSPIPGPRHAALIQHHVLTEPCPRSEAPGIPSLLFLVRPDRSDPGHDSPPA